MPSGGKTSKKAEKGKLGRILSSYFREIRKIYVAGNFREESFIPC